MDKVNATTARPAEQHAAEAHRAQQSSATDRIDKQAAENKVRDAKLERDEQARKAIDSRPSQAHLNFQASLHANRSEAELKTSSS
ncbi:MULTISPECIES: hypothetical protein [unclassified Methylobacterium]|jgi:hypothetical protein|uniref:hypothetical protein n=1 Tax=unclassified Methylobacterium TaxID=2615210 RepID=UPI0011C1ED27|nr:MULTISPECIES: hypothetical protein [unclassified Methylobacterium]QEE41218.1 hypothetical protein FVA80_21845 [Methylobacterium sp. WL1]TXN01408.1 hypothetical protein FV242_18560 [Methylobacterium sp. WL64]TXN55106.1 hypothetical protein FV241_21220 [Methylobacterium sp. WL2]